MPALVQSTSYVTFWVKIRTPVLIVNEADTRPTPLPPSHSSFLHSFPLLPFLCSLWKRWFENVVPYISVRLLGLLIDSCLGDCLDNGSLLVSENKAFRWLRLWKRCWLNTFEDNKRQRMWPPTHLDMGGVYFWLLPSPELLCDVSCFLLYLQFCDVLLLGSGKSFDSSWHKSRVESWKVEELGGEQQQQKKPSRIVHE